MAEMCALTVQNCQLEQNTLDPEEYDCKMAYSIFHDTTQIITPSPHDVMESDMFHSTNYLAD